MNFQERKELSPVTERERLTSGILCLVKVYFRNGD